MELSPTRCRGWATATQSGRSVLCCRVAELERQMRVDYEVLPPIVQDLKQEVTRFRAKLEKTEHLGWMGE